MPRTPQPPPLDGILVVDKPRGKTSHDVVETVRRLAGFRQIGHLGTLDPLATGVLVLALGTSYAARALLHRHAGSATPAPSVSDSRRTLTMPMVKRWAGFRACARSREIQALAAQFIGKIQQTPPAFSAKKIHGRPAHELARKNKPVELDPVEVEVYEFRLTGIEGAIAAVCVECGAGTYIRSLAHDLGKFHGSGAHLAEITRTAVGEFTLDHAVPLADLDEDAKSGKVAARVIRLESLLPELPRATVLPVVEKRVRHGAKFNLPLAQIQPGHATAAQGAPAELDSGEWNPRDCASSTSREN